MALCLAAGGLAAHLALSAFTLAWTHSVEGVRWEEDYRVEGGRLALVETRIKGSGAGMEPSPDARLEGGWYRFRPGLPPLERLELARSAFSRDYALCARSLCRPLGGLMHGLPEDAPVLLAACEQTAGTP